MKQIYLAAIAIGFSATLASAQNVQLCDNQAELQRDDCERTAPDNNASLRCTDSYLNAMNSCDINAIGQTGNTLGESRAKPFYNEAQARARPQARQVRPNGIDRGLRTPYMPPIQERAAPAMPGRTSPNVGPLEPRTYEVPQLRNSNPVTR
ncbi:MULTISPECIES: hypothetical protein [Rhodomicrobium]|uniref:hypothetical protein n=1 Tax=Rhodomicrobium TaxID=1068 RepID=UPI000B4AAA88|nr:MULTISPECIES: hypothetical protein [Rhodomicrobium]